MNNKVKMIAQDAIFLALLISLTVLFKYVLSIMDIMIPVLISLFIGIRYHKDKINRIMVISIALLGLSFIFLDPFSVLTFIIPGILLGIFGHFVLPILSTLKYFLLSFPAFFIIGSIQELMYSRLIMNMGFKEYLEIGLELPGDMVQKLGFVGLLAVFIVYNLIMAMLEVALMRMGVYAYERMLKRIGRK